MNDDIEILTFRKHVVYQGKKAQLHCLTLYKTHIKHTYKTTYKHIYTYKTKHFRLNNMRM